MSNLIHSFESHTSGRNARVNVYTDRIEWSLPRRLPAVITIPVAIASCGMSLLLPALRPGGGSASSEVIPMKSVTSVTIKRDGLINSKVSVIASGNTIDFRVSHTEAEAVKQAILSAIL